MTRDGRVQSHETNVNRKRLRTALPTAVAVVALVLFAYRGNEPKAAQPKPEPKKALALVKGSDCFSCHAVDHDVVGPAWDKVAERYRGKPDMVNLLALKIRGGSEGVWGKVPMPAHLNISEADAKIIAAWILSLKAPRKEAKAKTYTYKTQDGKTVTTHFPIFVSDKERKVTKTVFRGFELFDSYCFRCHGTDAIGGEYAPDLRQSLENGMTRKEFFTVAMEGRKAKGMPAWAGFFTAKDMQAIYEYTKGRSLGLVPPGRPPAEGD